MKKSSKKLSRSSTGLDIDIKELKYNKRTDLHESSLILEISGKDISPSIINAIRRVSMDEIPIYGFPAELIKIEGNNTIFNNDYMRLRLSQIPILDIDSGLDFLDKKYVNTELLFTDINYIRYEKEKVIEMYINTFNNTPENINITTNDITYLVDGETMNPYFKKYPILIIQLRPNETFKCHMKSALSTGLKSNIFSAASNCYYNYDEDKNKYIFTIESQGQIQEQVIIKKSVNYLLKKINDFKTYFTVQLKESTKYEKNSTLIFEFEDEDHTMGELINNAFQDHKNIIFCGLSKPSPLERLIKIKIASDNEHPLKYMIESMDYLKEIFETIKKAIK